MESQPEKNSDAGTPPTRDVAHKVDSCADRSQQRDNSGTECCGCNRRFGAEHAHPCSLPSCSCKGKGLIPGLGGCTRWMVAERRAAFGSKAALESKAAFESDTSSGDYGLVIADDPTPVPGADVPSLAKEDSGSVCSLFPGCFGRRFDRGIDTSVPEYGVVDSPEAHPCRSSGDLDLSHIHI